MTASSFPPEVIEAILECSSGDEQTIRTCALISKAALRIAQKFLYARLNWTNSMDRLRHHSFQRFVKLSVKYDYLPSYVISLRIAFGCHTGTADEPELHLDVQQQLPVLLSKMCNLRCLTVQGTVTRLVASCLGGIGYDFSTLPDEPRAALFRFIKSPKLHSLNFKHIRNLPMAEICSFGTFTHLGLVRCGFVPLDDPEEARFCRAASPGSPPSATPALRVIKSLTFSTRDIEAFTHLRNLSDRSGGRVALVDLSQVSSMVIASTADGDTEWKTSLWAHLGSHMSESLQHVTLFPSTEGLIAARVLDDTILDLSRLPNLKTLYWHAGNTMVVSSAIQSPLAPFVTTLQTATPDNVITDLYLNHFYQNVNRVPSARQAHERDDWNALDNLLVRKFPQLRAIFLYLPDSFPLRDLSTILPQAYRKGIIKAATDPVLALAFKQMHAVF